MFADHWVKKENGGIHNEPVIIDGIEVARWRVAPHKGESCGYEYIRMDTGEVYNRPDTYWELSPYGWERVDCKHDYPYCDCGEVPTNRRLSPFLMRRSSDQS